MRVAAVQMRSTKHREENLERAAALLAQAVQEGAKLIVFPEDFACFSADESERIQIREEFGDGRVQNYLRAASQKHQIYILGGTLPLAVRGSDKIASASLLYAPNGECIARYDKMHLFDVTVEDGKKDYRESVTTERGKEPVYIKVEGHSLGMSVCYDLRFPELFRYYSQNGCEMLVLPAAFTAVTGKAHWEILCRARAIENLSYFIAAGQEGLHDNGRETYGHTMIVDPWGEIIALRETGEGLAIADLDFEKLRETRQRFPALKHRVL